MTDADVQPGLCRQGGELGLPGPAPAAVGAESGSRDSSSGNVVWLTVSVLLVFVFVVPSIGIAATDRPNS